MNKLPKILLACVLLGIATPALAQDDTEDLRIAALEVGKSVPKKIREHVAPLLERKAV